MIPGLGVLYAPPLFRKGVLHRGVVSTEEPARLAESIHAPNWVIIHGQHAASPPIPHRRASLYQCDPFFDYAIGRRPKVHAICRDFVDERRYFPLDLHKPFDVVFNACWADVKRPLLFANALRYAARQGRPISCLWYGYHWSLPNGASTNGALERRVRERVAGLPVEFLPTDWEAGENNRRFNSARIAVLTSSAEGGPRVMSEAMLAGLPYLAAADVYGGSAAYLSPANKNGAVFEPRAKAVAECIWRALDRLDSFQPRNWALENMCRAVAVERMRHALRRLETKNHWRINWRGVDHDGSLEMDWWRHVLAADLETSVRINRARPAVHAR